jgi:hypothetical protein
MPVAAGSISETNCATQEIITAPAKKKKKNFFGVQEGVSGIIWNQESRSRIFLHPN